MDKTTNGTEKDRQTLKGKKVIEIGKEMARSDAERIDLPILMERQTLLAEAIKVIEDSRKSGLKSINYIERQFYIRNRQLLPYLRNLINLSCEATKYGFANGLAIEYLKKRSDLLEEILVNLVKESDASQKKLFDELEKVKTSIDSPMITNVHNYIEMLKKNIAEYQKKREVNDLAE